MKELAFLVWLLIPLISMAQHKSLSSKGSSAHAILSHSSNSSNDSGDESEEHHHNNSSDSFQDFKLSQPEESAKDIEFKYEKIFAQNPSIPHAPLLRLLSYFDASAANIKNKEYITFVDFSLDSNVPRMYVIDMRDGTATKYLVAHGSGTDPKKTGKARRFSNREESNMSSLGIYYTGNTFDGRHDNSLQLMGLESTNNKALDRGILVHGAAYVSPDRDPLGRSSGCFAVEEKHIDKIVDEIKHGSLLMSWIDPKLLDD
jgi:hypothetical protein